MNEIRARRLRNLRDRRIGETPMQSLRYGRKHRTTRRLTVTGGSIVSITGRPYVFLQERPAFATREISIDSRQELFADDLSVLNRINAHFGQFPALFRLLVRNVSVVLNDESIVSNERSAGIEAMDFHRVDPPIDFAANAVFSACLRRTAAGAVCFHANDVVVVKRVARFVPRLFANQLHHFFCNLFSVHFFLLCLYYFVTNCRASATADAGRFTETPYNINFSSRSS